MNENNLARSVSLSELIAWVKQDLLSEEARNNDPVPLFTIDEVTVEVNFTVEANDEGKISLKIIEFGGGVSGQTVQKATIKLTPILTKEESIQLLKKKHPELFKEVEETIKVVFRGENRVVGGIR